MIQKEIAITFNKLSIDVKQLPSGFYTVELMIDEKIYTGKFIKN